MMCSLCVFVRTNDKYVDVLTFNDVIRFVCERVLNRNGTMHCRRLVFYVLYYRRTMKINMIWHKHTPIIKESKTH